MLVMLHTSVGVKQSVQPMQYVFQRG